MTDPSTPFSAALADRYVIERTLGQGGMATVYLARDLKHEREVAIKVLREDLSASLGAGRFLREIKIAAQLQHPHILPLLDSGEAAGALYFVMPYIKGESLRERLDREGELPIQEAVRLISEVVDALAEAHAHGVVHRDIKPDNVMLSGRHALVTDFGVAKAISEVTGGNTITTLGLAVGTPTYMSPEQASADPQIDHRSDIYSVGAMAYELLTGRPPFTGTTPQQVLAAHVTSAPDSTIKHRSTIPVLLDAVVTKCLEKRPADRYQTALELLTALEPLATPATGITPASTPPFRMRRPAMRWTVAAAVFVIATLAFAVLRRAPATASLEANAQVTRSNGVEERPRLSPDGKSVAYSIRGPDDTISRVEVRRVDGGDAVRIDAALLPLGWAPGGDRLLVRTRRGVETVPALGGAPTLVRAAASDAAWSADGKRVVVVVGDSLVVSAPDGGEPVLLARLSDPHSPAWSPDGRWIAVVSGNSSYTEFSIAPSNVWLLPTSVGGSPAPLTSGGNMYQSRAWAPDSKRLLVVSDRDGVRDLYQLTITSKGTVRGNAARISTGLSPSLISVSADGASVAYSLATNYSSIWKVKLAGDRAVSTRDAVPVRHEVERIESFAISGNGKWLAFDSNRAGRQQIFRMPTQGGPVDQVTNDSFPAFAPSLSPDGSEVAYHVVAHDLRRVFVKHVDDGAAHQISSGVRASEIQPQWSPDGKRIAWLESDHPGDLLKSAAFVERNDKGWSAPSHVSSSLPILTSTWLDSGRNILAADATLRGFVQPVTGGAARLITTQPTDPQRTPASPFMSAEQRIVYVPYALHGMTVTHAISALSLDDGGSRDVVRFDEPGRVHTILGWSAAEYGGWIYFGLSDPQSDIWIAHIKGFDR